MNETYDVSALRGKGDFEREGAQGCNCLLFPPFRDINCHVPAAISAVVAVWDFKGS